MKEVINGVSDLGEGGSLGNGVTSDAVTAFRERRDKRRIGWRDQGRVRDELGELLGANQDGSEL